MQSGLKSLSKIFVESVFRIPDYQRGYSWEHRHLRDFWNDIEQLPTDKSHYTGVLTLEPVSKDDYSKWEDDRWIIEGKRYNPLYVVDGQQRLTTAIILIQSIVESVPNGVFLNFNMTKDDIKRQYIFESKDQGISRSYIFGYEKDNPSHEFLKQEIYGECSNIHSLSESTTYTNNLANAKSFFSKRLEGLSIEEIGRLFSKVTQNLLFNIFYIEEDLDVFVTFETMNNRGKPLSHLEILKNRLIYLSTRFGVDKHEGETLRKSVNESWKAVYHHLGLTKTRSDERFLLVHFFKYFVPGLKKASPEDEPTSYQNSVRRFLHDDQIYKDMLLEEIFTPKRLVPGDKALSPDEIYRYVQDIKTTVRTFHWVMQPESSSWTDAEKVSLDQLSRLTSLKRMFEFDVSLAAVLTMTEVKDAHVRASLLLNIERFGFVRRIRTYAFQEFHLEELLVQLLAGKKSGEEVSKEIASQVNKVVSRSEFKDSLRLLGRDKGYYGWVAIRYYLFEFEQHLRMLSKTSRELLTWSDYVREPFRLDHGTVEHIYPRVATDPYWKEAFKGYSVQERNLLRNSLGNLLPVSRGKNASLSNKSFLAKKGSLDQPIGYSFGSLSEIQVAQESDWDACRIVARGIRGLDFLENRWGIPLGKAKDKLAILRLEFVLSREGKSLDEIMSLPEIVPPVEAIDRAFSILSKSEEIEGRAAEDENGDSLDETFDFLDA